MSKMVLLIFLFLLMSVMGSFMTIQKHKTSSDAAESFTRVVSEVAGHVHYSLSKNYGKALYLPRAMEGIGFSRTEIISFEQDYSIVVFHVLDNDRLVFMMAWQDVIEADEILDGNMAFAASFIDLEPGTEIKFFEVEGITGSKVDMNEVKEKQFLVRPSPLNEDERDRYILFYKDTTGTDKMFCIAKTKGSFSNDDTKLRSILEELGTVCHS